MKFHSLLLILFVGLLTTQTQAATYTVTNANDISGGSLRAAIASANSTAADDTIIFSIPPNDPNCTPGGVCTIPLVGTLTVNDASTAGKLTIANSSGASRLLISGNNASRVFFLNSGANLTINGVTITNGKPPRSSFNGFGAGIYNNGGALTLINSVVTNNSFQTGGGGGGIYNNNGTLTLTGSTVSNNSSTGPGGIWNFGTATLNNSIVNGNISQQVGGGIYSDGTLTLTGSTVNGNSAQIGGGGIYNVRGTLALTNSTVSGNTLAGYDFAGGGGIFNGDAAIITNSTISDNSAQQSGGRGGGIFNNFYNNLGTMTITNSTVSGNSAQQGGGIWNFGKLNLTGVTVTNNKSTDANANCTFCAGGISNREYNEINLNNTIVAGNTDAASSGAPDVRGAVSSTSSYNLVGNNQNMTGIADGTNGNQVGTPANPIDARLAPLADNGAATQTHALLPDSPAIDKGSSFNLTTDQRGLIRPVDLPDYADAAGGDGADIGSFEVQDAAVAGRSQILFTRVEAGNSDVYKMNSDGSNEVRITNTAYSEFSPRWSPNLQKIVYFGNQDGSNTQIYSMNADGSGVTRLTNSATRDRTPDWSPDGTKIVFERCDATTFVCDIWVMRSDGSNQTNLTQSSTADEVEPKWSPDGTKIIFSRADDVNNVTYADIFTMNADGGNIQRLTNSSTANYLYNQQAVYSPDESKIAFMRQSGTSPSDREIYVMNADGSNQTNLTNNSVSDFVPVWSPDGTRIAFTSNRAGNDEIYTMNVNGSGVIRLTNNAVSDVSSDWRAFSFPEETPTGQNVTVETPSGDASVTFSQVVTQGTTTFTVIPPASAGLPPPNFTILENETAYDIQTTASYIPPVTVCFEVSSINDPAEFARVRILHGENGQLIDRTILPPDSPAPDFATRTVCARVNSLSPFVLGLAPTGVDLALSMTVSPDPVASGGSLTYQITLTNNGGSAAQNVVLTQSDFFRQRGGRRLTVESITAPSDFTCQNANPVIDPPFAEVVCRGNLGAGQQAQFTIVKRQQTPLARGMIVYHAAEVSSDSSETNMQDNRATDTTTVR